MSGRTPLPPMACPGQPVPMCACAKSLWRFTGSVSGNDRWRTELVVHADRGKIHLRLCREVFEECGESQGPIGCPVTDLAEINVQILDRYRPIRRKHVFYATAGGPACLSFGGAPEGVVT